MQAEIHETHTGVVVLVGDRAYKAKKPIVTDFLDFSTVARREEVCARELFLNRRLAPDSYLGLAHLTDPVGGDAEPVIVMRRYPDTFRLSSMVARGEPVEQHVSAIAAKLAEFHATADRSPAIDACARVPAVRGRWEQNLAELQQYTGIAVAAERLADIERMAMQFIAGRDELFAERIAGQRIVDGHGDLLANDIFCLPEGPAMLDCLEFDDTLRYVDCIDDVSFLAMDLEFLGRRDLAELLVRRYRDLTGDAAPPALDRFYRAYRAVVRAKVDCIRAGQGAASSTDDARRHLDLAYEQLLAATVRLIVVGGGPGTGKTTLSHALADELEAQVISTDDVRRELQQSGVIEGTAGAYNTGLYSPANVAAVYESVLDRAARSLRRGQSVILDGTWRDPDRLEQVYAIAQQYHCATTELECMVTLEAAQQRITGRTNSSSQATPEIAAAMAHDKQPWRAAHRIDTSRPLADSVVEAVEACRFSDRP